MSATRRNEHELLRKLLVKILSGNKPGFDNGRSENGGGKHLAQMVVELLEIQGRTTAFS